MSTTTNRGASPLLKDMPGQASRSGRWPYRVVCPTSGTKVTDDSPAELLRRGIDLCHYSDGATALLGIGAETPAAVLVPTDIGKIDLLDFIDTVVTFTPVPVLVGITTAGESMQLGFAALEHGARGLIPIPSSAERITAALKQAGLNPVPTTTELICGPVTLNQQSMRVTIDGHSVHLAPQEFEVLKYLMRESPRVLAPDEIAEHCNRDSTSGVAGIRTAILRARRKLAEAPGVSTPLIENVRGIGYRMAD